MAPDTWMMASLCAILASMLVAYNFLDTSAITPLKSKYRNSAPPPIPPMWMTANITVAKDGTGDCKTVREAVAMAPEMSEDFFRIDIKAGFYRENVQVGEKKTNLFFAGEGMGKSIISFNLTASGARYDRSAATVRVSGRGFMAVNISFENTARGKPNTFALWNEADGSAFYNCSVFGFMDAVSFQSSEKKDTASFHIGNQYYGDFYIYGAAHLGEVVVNMDGNFAILSSNNITSAPWYADAIAARL